MEKRFPNTLFITKDRKMFEANVVAFQTNEEIPYIAVEEVTRGVQVLYNVIEILVLDNSMGNIVSEQPASFDDFASTGDKGEQEMQKGKMFHLN